MIGHWERTGTWNQEWLAVRLLIDVLHRDHDHKAAATLIGAYDASPFAGPAYGNDAIRLADAIDRARKSLGDDRYDHAYRHGTTLTDSQAASLAPHSPAERGVRLLDTVSMFSM